MQNDKVIEFIRRATHGVCQTMLGLDLVDGEAFCDREGPGSQEGVIALIGLAGSWAGTGTFICSAEMACKVSSALLMEEYAAVDNNVLDAVGEVTNMILGNVKTDIEEELGPMGLSIPTVVFGRNFTTKTVGKAEWIVVRFHYHDSARGLEECVEVRLCVMPKAASEAPRISPAYSARG